MSRILIVEDNAMHRRLVRDILRPRGHELLEAETIDAGRALLAGEPPDLVLLDVHVTGGGGETLLREIRADARLAGLPVVAVTAQAMRGDRERLLSAGFDGYVSKPISARNFGAEIEAYIHRELPR